MAAFPSRLRAAQAPRHSGRRPARSGALDLLPTIRHRRPDALPSAGPVRWQDPARACGLPAIPPSVARPRHVPGPHSGSGMRSISNNSCRNLSPLARAYLRALSLLSSVRRCHCDDCSLYRSSFFINIRMSMRVLPLSFCLRPWPSWFLLSRRSAPRPAHSWAGRVPGKLPAAQWRPGSGTMP